MAILRRLGLEYFLAFPRGSSGSVPWGHGITGGYKKMGFNLELKELIAFLVGEQALKSLCNNFIANSRLPNCHVIY